MAHALCKHCGEACDCGESRCCGCSICAEQMQCVHVVCGHPGYWRHGERCSRSGKSQIGGRWYCATHAKMLGSGNQASPANSDTTHRSAAK